MDISGAEIRAISYISNDEYMLDCYSKKLDPYLTLAAQLDPEHDRAYHKQIRWKYKMILLGSIYGMGIQMLANMTGMPIEECTQKHTEMFNRMTGIGRFIKEYGTYCVEHEGRCNSIMGDTLQMNRNEKDRWARLGVNQVIQGFAACSLADGFFNVNYQSYMHPERIGNIRVWNTVHDSSQNYFQIDKLFEIRDYYYETLTEYLWNKYKVRYEFDVEVGANYFDMCEYKNLTQTKLELGGSYTAVKKLLDKIKSSGMLNFEIESLKRNDKEYECKLNCDGWYSDDFVPEQDEHIYARFANRGQYFMARAAYEQDRSNYTVVINKLSC